MSLPLQHEPDIHCGSNMTARVLGWINRHCVLTDERERVLVWTLLA